MRQSALGPSDPATIRNLDMFTGLYDEEDRKKYAGEYECLCKTNVV